ncbi:MAG TPA: nucleotide exchange factor GrpE [Allocoleopsis sp.]
MNNLNLTVDQRDQLLEKFGILLKTKVSLEQSLRSQETLATAKNEELFLELLEVVDALDFLLDYLAENPQISPQFIKRLPKTLETVQRKLLSVLKKREVNEIEFDGNKPDFNLCRVVDCEILPDVEEGSISKVVRRGFSVGEKVLRPLEVITAKNS